MRFDTANARGVNRIIELPHVQPLGTPNFVSHIVSPNRPRARVTEEVDSCALETRLNPHVASCRPCLGSWFTSLAFWPTFVHPPYHYCSSTPTIERL